MIEHLHRVSANLLRMQRRMFSQLLAGGLPAAYLSLLDDPAERIAGTWAVALTEPEAPPGKPEAESKFAPRPWRGMKPEPFIAPAPLAAVPSSKLPQAIAIKPPPSPSRERAVFPAAARSLHFSRPASPAVPARIEAPRVQAIGSAIVEPENSSPGEFAPLPPNVHPMTMHHERAELPATERNLPAPAGVQWPPAKGTRDDAHVLSVASFPAAPQPVAEALLASREIPQPAPFRLAQGAAAIGAVLSQNVHARAIITATPECSSSPVSAPRLPAASHVDELPTVPVPAPAPGDVDAVIEEIERRLRLELLRHYGTSGA